jgi:hypothetical protein
MTYLYDFILYLSGFITGFYVFSFYLKYKLSQDLKKSKKELDSIYSNLLTNVSNGNSKFIYRINNYLRIDTQIENLGNVNIFFYTNKNNINIFRGDDILYTSHNVDSDILQKLNFLLKTKYSVEINDTVNVFGLVYSRKYFIETFNLNPNIFNNKIDEPIQKDEEVVLDIDSILDKINSVGFNNLTKKEKEFLNKYSKK